MSEEWEKLDIYNLPPDIFVPKKYNFQARSKSGQIQWTECKIKTVPIGWIHDAVEGKNIFYQNRQLIPPSHEEIMTKWWEDSNGDWVKVVRYRNSGEDTPYRLGYDEMCKSGTIGVSNVWFIGRNSADIPPEANNGNQ